MASTNVAQLQQGQVLDTPKTAGPVASFKAFLVKHKDQMALALPSHMKVDPVISAAVSEFARNESLQKCTPASIVSSLVSACRLGLVPGANGAGFLVAYGATCTFVPGWRGLVDLVSRSGNGTVYTGVIFSDQEYTFTDGARRDLVIHNETDLEAPEDITHAYAIGWVKGASMPIIELWRVSKIIKHRDKYNKVGKKHYSFRDWEMYARKVPLLQVLKYMPCSVEVQRAIELANATEDGRAATIDGEFIVTSSEPAFDPEGSQAANNGGSFDSTDSPVAKDDSSAKRTDNDRQVTPRQAAPEPTTPSTNNGGFDGPTVEDALANVARGDYDMARDIANSLNAEDAAAVEKAIATATNKPSATNKSGGQSSFRNVE